jgi:signal transduction histidine kinase
VSPQELGHLFEAFRSETEDGSVGYGLAIVKALTEAQGGEIRYQDAEPQGACFTVLLPAGRLNVTSGLDDEGETAPKSQVTLSSP